MITIDRVETILVDLPTIRPHTLAMATMNRQTLCIVRLYAADGIVGIGEGTTIGGLAYGPESPESIKLTIDNYMAPLIIGTDATRPAVAMALLERHVVGNSFAKCAVETALLDAQGKRVGLPVSELLGGRVHASLPVAWTLASGLTERDIDEAEQMLSEQRHRIFKLKIGKRAFRDDVAHVAAIKRALGARASVRVDVNMAWHEAEAKTAIAMLEEAGCDLVEQPIHRANREGMRRLRERAGIPIMADESVNGPADAFALASSGAADVLSVKIAQSGGPRNATVVARIAEAAGVAVYGGTMLESGVGTAASIHVCSTFSSLPFGTEQFGPLLLCEDILAEPLVYRDFGVSVPEGSGLGIAIDEDRLRFFARDGARRTTVGS